MPDSVERSQPTDEDESDVTYQEVVEKNVVDELGRLLRQANVDDSYLDSMPVQPFAIE